MKNTKHKNEELFNSIKKYIDANYESVSKEIEQKGKILKKRLKNK